MSTLDTQIQQFRDNMARVGQLVNGSDATLVASGSGSLPSFAKLQKDAIAQIDSDVGDYLNVTVQTQINAFLANKDAAINVSANSILTQATTARDAAQALSGTLQLVYNSGVTATDPGSGKIRFDNTNPSVVTHLYISATDVPNTAIGPLLDLLDDSNNVQSKAIILLRDVGSGRSAAFRVIGAVVDNGAWRDVPVAYVSGTGSSFVNNNTVLFGFSLVGSRGATGAGSGDMLAENNLGDVFNTDQSLSNLGLTAIGKSIARASNQLAVKTLLALEQVNNTSDAAKPVSTATATALAGKEPSIPAGTSAQYWRGDKTMQTLNPAAIGLGAVENKSSAQIRAEITSSDITTGLGYTPINQSAIGVANGVVPLGSDVKISAAYLPSYVDDVQEYASTSAFPSPGEGGKLYVSLADNSIWRWSGSIYIAISTVTSPGTTDVVTEGAINKYFTNARARAAILASGSGITYDNSTGVIALSLPVSGNANASQVVLGGDTRLSDSRPASDVYTWAKAPVKPTYVWSEIQSKPSFAAVAFSGSYNDLSEKPSGTGTVSTGADIIAALGYTPLDTAKVGAINGVAPLGADAKISATYLPSYVDDVLEYANFAALPSAGETGKIYITLNTNAQYRWSGSVYIQLTASPGTTDAVAEGSTNLYFTTARARAAVSAAGTGLSYSPSTGVYTLATPASGNASASQVVLGNDGRLSDSRPASDVYTWAKQPTKPSYAYSELTGTPSLAQVATSGSYVDLTNKPTIPAAYTLPAATSAVLGGVKVGAGLSVQLDGTIAATFTSIVSADVTSALGYTPVSQSLIGAANGIVPLGSDSKISSTYLPSYVDDVLEYANAAALPGTGETGKIYIALDTNSQYRWSGSGYVQLVGSPGSTDAVPEGSTNKYFTTARARTSIIVNGDLSYNSSTGILAYSLPIAAGSVLGGIKVGTGLTIASDGTLSTSASGGGTYTDEQAQDAAANLFGHTNHVGISFVYDDANNQLIGTVGNAATATQLATSRNINGVAFNGTASITINAVDSTARVASSEKGAANGVASLDSSGKINVTQYGTTIAQLDGSSYIPLANIPPLSFSKLSNFSVTSPAAGQFLVHDGTTFINRDQVTLQASLPAVSGYLPGEEIVNSTTGKQFVCVNQDGTKFWLQRG